MLGNRLKEIRMKEYMMNSGQFAEMLGINSSTYSMIENGKRGVSLENAFSIAQKLNKKIEDIWYREEY